MHICNNPNHKNIDDCYNAFKGISFPRQDEFVLNMDIYNYQCELGRLKLLLIRLRRRPDAKDWNEFFAIWLRGYKQYIKLFDSRWIVSVLETFADHAPEHLSVPAMLVASNITWERWHHTLDLSARIIRTNPNPFVVGQKEIYDGLMTQQLKWADTPTNYYERMMNVLKRQPIIRDVFIELTNRQINNKESLISQIINVSDWDMKGSILNKIK